MTDWAWTSSVIRDLQGLLQLLLLLKLFWCSYCLA